MKSARLYLREVSLSQPQHVPPVPPNEEDNVNSETIDGGPSSSSAPESSPSGRGHQSNGGDLLLQWIDHYEEAVTNHYSPELRARVSAVRTNGLGSEMLLPPSTTPVYRLASKAGGFKVKSRLIHYVFDFF